ncbi:MAG TPA: hypothetical protein VI758_03690, partial [Bacteroidota bacterium]
MKSHLLIPGLLAILLFTGCYTQLYVEKERPEIVQSEPVMVPLPTADTITYIYYPQNEFLPIDGVTAESDNPLVPGSGEIEQQPQATDEWLVNPLPFGQQSDWVGEHTTYTIEPGSVILIDLLPRSQPIQTIGVPTGPFNTWH